MYKQLFKLSTVVLAGFLSVSATSLHAQTGPTRYSGFAAAVFMTVNGNAKAYNLAGSGANVIAPTGNSFTGGFGTFIQNSASLWLMGSEVKTYKESGANVCGVSFIYNIYPYCNGCAIPPSTTAMDLNFKADCNNGVFADGYGPCSFGDQKWSKDDNGIDLTNRSPGTYVMDVIYKIKGDNYNPYGCGKTAVWGGYAYSDGYFSTGYRALFTIVAPNAVRPAAESNSGLTATTNGAAGLKVYPSPATSAITIDPVNFDEGAVSIEIANIQGSIIKNVGSDFAQGQRISLDMSSYAPGMYFVRLQQGSKTAVAKVVKQ